MFLKIRDATNFVFAGLTKEGYLQNLSKEDFVKRLAHFYDQLNYIHPFREGNGRAQRVFWNRVAKDAGYELDWSLVVGDENDEAPKGRRTDGFIWPAGDVWKDSPKIVLACCSLYQVIK